MTTNNILSLWFQPIFFFIILFTLSCTNTKPLSKVNAGDVVFIIRHVHVNENIISATFVDCRQTSIGKECIKNIILEANTQPLEKNKPYIEYIFLSGHGTYLIKKFEHPYDCIDMVYLTYTLTEMESPPCDSTFGLSPFWLNNIRDSVIRNRVTID